MERGFARVTCPSCQYEILVPFSCKVRGLCPSCDGRRMAAGAADLVDHILPVVADYRQWTLSLPRWLRIRLLRDKALVSEVLLVFVRVVSAYHRRRARDRGIAGGQTGAVTAIQRARLEVRHESADAQRLVHLARHASVEIIAAAHRRETAEVTSWRVPSFLLVHGIS